MKGHFCMNLAASVYASGSYQGYKVKKKAIL